MRGSLAINTAAKFVIAVAVIAVIMGLIYYYGILEMGGLKADQEAREACEKLKTNYGCNYDSSYAKDELTSKCIDAGYVDENGEALLERCCALYC